MSTVSKEKFTSKETSQQFEESFEFRNRDSRDFWFACVDIQVIRDRMLSPCDKAVYAVICSHVNVETRSCPLRIRTIAEEAKCSVRSVQESLKALVERGVIERMPRFENGKQKASIYRIVGHRAQCYNNSNSQDTKFSSQGKRSGNDAGKDAGFSTPADRDLNRGAKFAPHTESRDAESAPPTNRALSRDAKSAPLVESKDAKFAPPIDRAFLRDAESAPLADGRDAEFAPPTDRALSRGAESAPIVESCTHRGAKNDPPSLLEPNIYHYSPSERETSSRRAENFHEIVVSQKPKPETPSEDVGFQNAASQNETGTSKNGYLPGANGSDLIAPDEVPSAMRETVDYFLLKTGRTGIEPEELSAVCALEEIHTPARVNKEIAQAIERFKKNGRPLSSLTLVYIYKSLQYQNSRQNVQSKSQPKESTGYDEFLYDYEDEDVYLCAQSY
jgi:hypothetical protein